MNLLKIENLTKIYPNGVQALDHVSLNISNGMFGLLGPNGAGKSTLMRTIAALQEPTKGTVFFNDDDIIRNPVAIRKQLGYLPQEFGVYPGVSAIDLLSHIAILKGMTNKAERNKQIIELLHRTNLFEHRKKSVSTFSGGMRQRFGIAQALLGKPKLIVVDEPTAGLDPEERNRFHNLLSEIGENIVIILSTHIVEDVSDLCNDMAIINKGKVMNQGNPSELIQELKGKVWQASIEKSQLDEYRGKYNVISSQFHLGKIVIKIIENTDPGEEFEMIESNLEDVYFNTLNQANYSEIC